jgi:hypothetical protein
MPAIAGTLGDDAKLIGAQKARDGILPSVPIENYNPSF